MSVMSGIRIQIFHKSARLNWKSLNCVFVVVVFVVVVFVVIVFVVVVFIVDRRRPPSPDRPLIVRTQNEQDSFNVYVAQAQSFHFISQATVRDTA